MQKPCGLLFHLLPQKNIFPHTHTCLPPEGDKAASRLATESEYTGRSMILKMVDGAKGRQVGLRREVQ